MDRAIEVIRHWQEQLASSFMFAMVGIIIGLGQLFTGNERLTLRLLLGRSLSTGGLAMAAGVILVWVPELSLSGQIGVAAMLASMGTSGLERVFQRVIEARR